jgi:hypothetical protein
MGAVECLSGLGREGLGSVPELEFSEEALLGFGDCLGVACGDFGFGDGGFGGGCGLLDGSLGLLGENSAVAGGLGVALEDGCGDGVMGCRGLDWSGVFGRVQAVAALAVCGEAFGGETAEVMCDGVRRSGIGPRGGKALVELILFRLLLVQRRTHFLGNRLT